MRMRFILMATALAVSLAPLPAGAFSFFTFGSGGLNGGYFSAAREICERVNRNSGGDIRCSPESTPGSAYNLNALSAGELDIALAQSDWQRHAVNGTGSFKASGARTQLRSVMSLYPESVTFFARKGLSIKDASGFEDLVVDIGHPASGRHNTALYLFKAFNLTAENFQELLELPSDVAISGLCAGTIDATILVVGHPNTAVARALSECDVEILSLNNANFARFLTDNPDYSEAYIPISAYPELAMDVPTVAVMATVLTQASMDPETVRLLVAETLANKDLLGRRIPLLAGLEPAEMAVKGLTAPLHPGAQAAFDAFAQE